jgi:hypothetical protein
LRSTAARRKQLDWYVTEVIDPNDEYVSPRRDMFLERRREHDSCAVRGRRYELGLLDSARCADSRLRGGS